MKLLTSFVQDKITEPTAITVGKFDGIHKGHDYLVSRVIEQKKRGLSAVMVTFDMSPRIALGDREDVSLLTNEEKYFLLEKRGIDYLIECPFEKEIVLMEPEEFFLQLVNRFSMKYMAAGIDFRFGHNGRGDVFLLEKLARKEGIVLEIKDKIREDQREISSTYIREEISRGNLEKANHLLGHPYFLCGTVVHGNHLGNQLGFPTINVIPPAQKMLPPFGVYATRVLADEKWYEGMTNVGKKPTIAGDRLPGVETNIFDFSGDLYEKNVVIAFYRHLRPEQKFSTMEQLSSQIKKDCGQVKEFFMQNTDTKDPFKTSSS